MCVNLDELCIIIHMRICHSSGCIQCSSHENLKQKESLLLDNGSTLDSVSSWGILNHVKVAKIYEVTWVWTTLFLVCHVHYL